MPFKSIDKIDGSDTGLTLEEILTYTERARGRQFVEPMRNAMQSISNISALTVAEMIDILDRLAR